MLEVLPLLTRSSPGTFCESSSVRVVWSELDILVTNICGVDVFFMDLAS